MKTNKVQPPKPGKVQLDANAAGILQTLLNERNAIDAKISYFLNQCALAQNVDLQTFDLHLPTMTFIPKQSSK